MKILVSEKLSEHKYKTPEGYLICTDAILARTGKQTYTKDEVFGDGDNTEIDIDRPYDQVMNEKTIASFENKPVTFDHPEEDVNVGNYKSYAVGYVRDVHQGKVDGKDVILGNLVITDQDAINAIESGEHTDLSCGYDCDIKDDGNGGYAQNNIRGNHVALCKEGRAGMARIVDSKTHVFSRIRDSYVIEELPEDETIDIYVPILKKYNLKIQKLSGNKVKVIGNRNDIVRYYDKEIGIDEDDIGIVDSKARDLVDDSKELVVGKWYEFAKKIEVERNQYATSLRISGKSGNVYRYTIYLKNGEMHGSGTYSEIKERFNIKDSKVDSKMNDANDYSWFKGHINGDLQSYNINSLINNVKSKRQSLHTNLTGKSGNVYTVFIEGSLESNLDEGSNMWIDIIAEKPDGQQKRLVSKKFNSWNECQKIFNDFKNRVRDSKMKDADSKVVDQSVKDAEWSNDWANLDDLGINDRDKKEVEAYFKKLASKYGVSYVRTDYSYGDPCPTFRGNRKNLEKLILKEYVGGSKSDAEEEYELIEDSVKDNDIHDSKEMTMSDAIKMLNIVDAYKKAKDNYMGVLPKERRYRYRGWVIIDRGYSSAPYSIEDYHYAKEFRTLEEAKAFIRKELSDSKEMTK